MSYWILIAKKNGDSSDWLEIQGNPEKLIRVLKYPEMIEAIAGVLDYGVKRGYEDEDWLKPEGKTMSNKANFDSANHHRANHFAGKLYDESGELHAAHSGTRDLMAVVRIKRGIVHPDDVSPRIKALQKLGGCQALTIDEALEKYKGSQYSKPEDGEDNHQL